MTSRTPIQHVLSHSDRFLSLQPVKDLKVFVFFPLAFLAHGHTKEALLPPPQLFEASLSLLPPLHLRLGHNQEALLSVSTSV